MTTKMRVAAVLALLAGPVAVQAMPITVDFSVTSTDSSSAGYGAGVVGSGFFTFDDSLMPAGGSGGVGNPITSLTTLDLAFDWFGANFDESNAKIATLTFNDGVLSDWWIGGNYTAPICGLQRYSCVHSAGTVPDFYVIASSSATLNDGVHGGFGSGTTTWSIRTPQTDVPEPATLALFGAGLAGIGLARRKKERRLVLAAA